MKVFEAVAAVMGDVGAVKKDGRNTQQNFKFRGIDAVVNALSPAMRKHGLTVYPSKVEHRNGSTQLSGGKTATAPVVVVDYTFVGPEGDTFTSQVVAESFDLGDKATAKAMSVALRTCLLQTFMLPTDDADPDEHTYERQTYSQPRPAAPAGDAGATSLGQYRHDQPNWTESLDKAKNNIDLLRDLLSKAQNMSAPADVIESITAAGKSLAARTN
jgi:hypothetical protein